MISEEDKRITKKLEHSKIVKILKYIFG